MNKNDLTTGSVTSKLFFFVLPILVGVKPSVGCVLAILLFGFNTGIGFYFNAKAIPLVPLYMVPVIQCTMVFFSICWGILFFHEVITPYIIGGAILFIIGIIGIQTAGNK